MDDNYEPKSKDDLRARRHGRRRLTTKPTWTTDQGTSNAKSKSSQRPHPRARRRTSADTRGTAWPHTARPTSTPTTHDMAWYVIPEGCYVLGALVGTGEATWIATQQTWTCDDDNFGWSRESERERERESERQRARERRRERERAGESQ
jgi:hypothetical protein